MELQDNAKSRSHDDDDGQKGNSQSPNTPVKRAKRIPQMHLVITNISKRPNIRALLLNAAAFGCQSVLMVGQRNFDIDPQSTDMPGPLKAHVVSIDSSWERNQQRTDDSSSSSPSATDLPSTAGTATTNNSSKLVIRRFEKWNDCCDYMAKKRIRLVGVEIHKDAVSIEEFLSQCSSSCSHLNNNHNDDDSDVAFIMGNEGQGLHEKHMASCDTFIRIPQYGVGTASLNVYVAASLVLHRFHQWQLEQREYNNQGILLDDK